MEESENFEFEKLINLETIKEFCNAHLFDIAIGGIKDETHHIKIRFIDLYGNFGFTGLGRFFFVDDCMYLITQDLKYEKDHNPDVLDFSKELEILKFTGDIIVRVIFAGIYTGFLDETGKRIFTGDVVKAEVLINPKYPSGGGQNPACNGSDFQNGILCEGGVNDLMGNYSLIFDNHCSPLSWAIKMHVVGSLFYNLSKNDTEIDIRNLCNSFAQSRQDKREREKLIKKSPYFTPTTWQEKAIELLCGNRNDDENE